MPSQEQRMTLETVADRAGVSTATVSRVLNNVGAVRASTRTRVMEAVRELRFHPNVHARALASGRTRTLGLIVSNIEKPYFLDIYAAFERMADRRGYEVLVESTGYRSSKLAAGVRSMLGRSLTGLGMIVSEMDEGLTAELRDSDLPVVFHDIGEASESATHIRIDWHEPMGRIGEHLYSLGHRRMAFVGHHVGLASLGARLESFLKAVRSYDEPVEFLTEADFDGPEGGRRAARKLLASGFEPTAILCVNDFMALGVLEALREKGLRVPEQVSVTGFDNIHLAEFTHPPLTTVDVPRGEIGRLTFEALVAESDGSRPEREIMVEPRLVIRESTGPVRSS